MDEQIGPTYRIPSFTRSGDRRCGVTSGQGTVWEQTVFLIQPPGVGGAWGGEKAVSRLFRELMDTTGVVPISRATERSATAW